MEDQIDRDRLLADASLRQAFKTWLLDPGHFSELDRGTLVIPPEFLAKSAIAPTPVGFAVSDLQPEFGLVQGDEGTGRSVVQRRRCGRRAEKGRRAGHADAEHRSVAGFERRLNDITCAGCHQTRGIGGFHFPGVDWMRKNPSNSTFVPASPHFFGDQIRRRDILTSLRDGRTPRLFARVLESSAAAGQRRTRRHRISRRLGIALLPSRCRVRNTRTRASVPGLVPRARLSGCGQHFAHGHVLHQNPIGASTLRKRLWRRYRPPDVCYPVGRLKSSDRFDVSQAETADEFFRQENKQRNQKIAENEAERQVVSAVRVSTWAIAVARRDCAGPRSAGCCSTTNKARLADDPQA